VSAAETASGALRRAAVLALLVLAGCATPAPKEPPTTGRFTTHEPLPDVRLHSVLWVQSSVEYANTTLQIFRMAAERLPQLSADPGRSALPGVLPDAALPPAVIVDVDETILDNSPHAARSILAHRGFDLETWRQWVREADAPAVPGAIAYLRTAARLGVRVFYVTNRHHELEPATRRNLAALGIPLEEGDGDDVILTYRERPDWSDDKTTRRAWVAARYRVLQIVGDDLKDFVAVPPETTVEYRSRLSDEHRARWGDDWFLIPNPIYGSWELAVTPDGRAIFDSPLSGTIRMLETE
jgi:5'-nucleotidase (lipoprotein e(P4) family)